MNLNRSIGMLTIRLVLGFIFLMQGIGKVFKWGLENVYQNNFVDYNTYFSTWFHYAVAYYTSYVELIGGVLLILGLWRDYALYALASVLVIVTFGHGLATPIWNMEHVIFRLILLVTILTLPKEWDIYRADNYLNKKRKPDS